MFAGIKTRKMLYFVITYLFWYKNLLGTYLEVNNINLNSYISSSIKKHLLYRAKQHIQVHD